MSENPSGDQEITVLGMEDEDDRSLWWRPDEARYGREIVSARALAERVEEFLSSMRTVLARLPEAVGQYELDQITVAAISETARAYFLVPLSMRPLATDCAANSSSASAVPSSP